MSDVDDRLSDFRVETRTWLEANFPPSLAFKNPVPYQNDADYAEADPDFLLWRERMAAKGWGAPDWPVQYGGGGLDPDQLKILTAEMVAIGAFNPMRNSGYTMLGPTLLQFGSEEQRQRHLPRIAAGTSRWCQGFSEPGAGSDLASLQARCIDMGDHWLVNGQKIWTSAAHHSDWCFALVRTDTAHKQGGISFLLIEMASAGVETRPIILISGASHFCEVFLTDVKVPKDNLVGAVNQGWTIAKKLLEHERDSLAAGRGDGRDLLPVARERLGVDAQGRIADAPLRGRLIDHAMRTHAYNLMMEQVTALAKAGQSTASMVPLIKNLGADIAQGHAELTLDIMGEAGLGWDGDDYSQDERDSTRQWLHSRAFTIYGGTTEIQNDILAKRMLGLPALGAAR